MRDKEKLLFLLIFSYIVVMIVTIFFVVSNLSNSLEVEIFDEGDATRLITTLPSLDSSISEGQVHQEVNLSEDAIDMFGNELERLHRIGDEVADIQNSIIIMEDAEELVETLRPMAAHFHTTRLRFAWFISHTDEIAWRFISPSFMTESEIPALWVLESSDGRLLAYVRGSYLVATGELINVELVHLVSSIHYVGFEDVERQGDLDDW